MLYATVLIDTWTDGRAHPSRDRKLVRACTTKFATERMLTYLPTGMNVIRMIKLFGWEPRIIKQLNEKRTEELISIKKNRLFAMMNNLCK